MAYNNGFPMGYQYYNPMQNNAYTPPQNAVTTQPTQNSIIWVQGEAGAKSYLVAPNTTVQLWDSEEQVIYLKSADASGMPSIKTLDYTIREMKQSHSPVGEVEYATKSDLEALRSELQEMVRKTPVRASKKEVEDNG